MGNHFQRINSGVVNGVDASSLRWASLTTPAQVIKPEPLPTGQKVATTSPVAELHADPFPKLNGRCIIARVHNSDSLRGFY